MRVQIRPWYVIDELCDDYVGYARDDLQMLQHLKVIRGLTLNFILLSVCLVGIFSGADATLLASLTVVALMVVNGVELSEYLAAKQALHEGKKLNDDQT